MEARPWLRLPERWWRFADTVEALRSMGLSSTVIASMTGCTVVQIEAVECVRRQVHDDLERAVRA